MSHRERFAGRRDATMAPRRHDQGRGAKVPNELTDRQLRRECPELAKLVAEDKLRINEAKAACRDRLAPAAWRELAALRAALARWVAHLA